MQTFFREYGLITAFILTAMAGYVHVNEHKEVFLARARDLISNQRVVETGDATAQAHNQYRPMPSHRMGLKLWDRCKNGDSIGPPHPVCLAYFSESGEGIRGAFDAPGRWQPPQKMMKSPLPLSKVRTQGNIRSQTD